ncbi:MAG: phosphate ABC transporter permease subunit PstC, partial [Leptolyngbyaceae cyanobacterium CAN_BIN12]|nr:phosphate ABC transporter permease subunit PstC [Leptolyngbyaceae cyanobacterium CAN_BIN12]
MTPSVDKTSGMSYERTQVSRTVDNVFKWLTRIFAIGIVLTLLAIALQVGRDALPAIQKFGIIDFVTGVRWNPVE